ncbi:MAG: DNA photolyase [Clostridiaceae bacterium]|jgi:spore photoproduct lyase|nr:DNA photolyase [Clostridiaceae bacterium]
MTLSASLPRRQRFEAVYAEERALDWPLTRRVLKRLDGCPVITIRHYKDVFNRSNQDPRWQKRHPSLILAVKDEPLLYPGPRLCQDFGAAAFYYANLAVGCPFDCTYCYLQGMYPSAHLLAFMNMPDFIQAMARAAADTPCAIAASHDTDLLALRQVIPYPELLAAGLAGLPLQAEIRTKSADRSFFLQNEPTAELVFAFSLAPEPIIGKLEPAAPPLDARLQAIQTAQARGFTVRLCFDPVFADWDTADYDAFYRHVFSIVDPSRVQDASFGFFRMPESFFRRARRLRPELMDLRTVLDTPSGVRTYPEDLRRAGQAIHLAFLGQYLDRRQIDIQS